MPLQAAAKAHHGGLLVSFTFSGALFDNMPQALAIRALRANERLAAANSKMTCFAASTALET
jgi:hypothetical protein